MDEGTGSFCLIGQNIHYEIENTKIDAIVIGEREYNNKIFCKAQSTKVLDSAIGDITVKTEYYFEESGIEAWIIVTTSNARMQKPQVVDTHILGGRIIP